MSSKVGTAPAALTPRPSPRRSTRTRSSGLVAALLLLAVVVFASIAVGSRSMTVGTVLHELIRYDGSDDGVIIRSLRLPRTVLGLVTGAALGLAGALMQALTRNPLADPGLLGVNAGASAAVVTAIAVLGLSSPLGYVWFALAGAGGASVLVYLLGTRGRSAATPVRLALAGTAISAALGAFVSGLTLAQPATFEVFRFWSVGSLSGRGLSVLADVGPFLAAGALIALGLARTLNAVALGDETSRALGAHLGRTQAWGITAITLLAGATTAAVGPIAFVGLTVPHVARAITGPDQRWVFPYSMVLAPILLLGADVAGRVIARPAEIGVGIVTAFVGAPVFIAIVRRGRVAAL